MSLIRAMMNRDELVRAIHEELHEGMAVKPLELAERIADRFRLGTETSPLTNALPTRFFDLRHEQDYVYPGNVRKAKIVGGKVVRRLPQDITHLVVHQTAVEFGLSDLQLKASNGDRELALARRALEVSCHLFASRSGFFVATHQLVDYIQHGNGFNAYSIGLEVEGRYSGLDDDPSTVAREDLRTTWKGEPTVLTDTTVRAAQDAIRYGVREGRALGMPLTTVVAHRQSSGTRRSDPGEGIWQRVVLPLLDELELVTDVHEVLHSPSTGHGRPIPLAWDPNGTGAY